MNWKFEAQNFSIPSQICWKNVFNALIKSFMLSNLALSYYQTSHWIFHIKKKKPLLLLWYFFLHVFRRLLLEESGYLPNETQVLTMGMFFGSGPTPSPTSIPLGLPSLEDSLAEISGWDVHIKRYTSYTNSYPSLKNLYNSSGFLGGSIWKTSMGSLWEWREFYPFRVHCTGGKKFVMGDQKQCLELGRNFWISNIIQHVILSGTNGEAT